MISPLDKRIAELKGWQFSETPGGTVYASGPAKSIDRPLWDPEWEWSKSDAKALELVDELGLDFRLEGKPGAWSAVIDYYGQHHQEVGDSRPEAICRAYIAAREWMATKEGA